MSKNFLKVPQGPILGSFLVLGHDDWAEIESATGYELSQNVRDLLGLATLHLTLMLPQEKSAPRLDGKLIEKLITLRAQAQNLRAELFSPHHWREEYQPDSRPMTPEHKLALELDYIRENIASPLTLLRFSLGATIDSCDHVLKMIGDATLGNYQDGSAYDTWIVLTTLIMKSSGLKYGVTNSKRRDENNVSSFVKLVKELQWRAIAKKVQSEDALAKAINRARGSIDASNIEDSEVEPLIYRLLHSSKPDGRSRLSGQSAYGAPNEFGALQELVNAVLEGQRVGLHSVVPEPLYGEGDPPPPEPAQTGTTTKP